MLLETKHRSEVAKQPQSVDGVQGLRSLRLPTRSSLRRRWELPPWPRRNWGIVDLWANGTICCQGICKKTGIYTAFTIIIIISYLIYGSFLHIFPQTTVQKAWWGNAIVQWCHTFHTLPADFQYWWATAPRSLKQPLWIEYFKQQYKPGANTSQRTRPILYNYVSFTLLFFFKYLPNLKPCGTGFQIPHLDVPSCCSSPWTAIPWAWMTFGDPGPSPAKWVASFKHADALGLAVTSSNERAITININKHTWDILRFWYSWKLWNPKQGLPD